MFDAAPVRETRSSVTVHDEILASRSFRNSSRVLIAAMAEFDPTTT
jgi:hypothetical protein